jgi:O-antigen ligase
MESGRPVGLVGAPTARYGIVTGMATSRDAGPGSVPQLPTARALRDVSRGLFLLFIASIPAEYSLVLPVLGSGTRLIGGLLLLTSISDVIARGSLRRLPGFFLLLLAFVLWSFASVVWSYEPALTVGRAFTYLQLLVMSWVIWEYVRTEQDLVATLQAYVLGSLLVAVVTIMDFQSLSVAALAITTDVRVAAFGANPNELALTMVTAVPIALYLLRRKPANWPGIVNAAYLGTGTLAVVLTASRAGFIALVVAGVGMLVMMRDARLAARVALVSTIALLAVLAASFVPDYTWERIASIGAKLQRMDFNNRALNWQAGLAMFAQDPVVGVGAGAFEGATAHLIDVPRSSHSTWIGVVVETGLVGAVLWFSAIAIALLGLRHAAGPLRRALLAAILPMVVGMLVTGWDHRKVPWLLFVTAACSVRLEGQSPQPEDDTPDTGSSA